MKNFVQPGTVLTVPAPYDVASGAGMLVGQQFGVAAFAALAGGDVEMMTTGVYDLVKIGSQAWGVGALVYWDNANKRCTTVASGNTLIGSAVLAVTNAAGNISGRVRLNGAAAAASA
ncbi:MAG: DUF2190 family protein [Inquilinus sp.]|uniref:DUF2190 family protein n=1 Tax=Inquilinus sp. TaxID=1932117 RepID=UPI003F398799